MTGQDDTNIVWNAPRNWCSEKRGCEAIWHVDWCPMQDDYQVNKLYSGLGKWFLTEGKKMYRQVAKEWLNKQNKCKKI